MTTLTGACGEALGGAMECRTGSEAREYFEALVDRFLAVQEWHPKGVYLNREKAERIVRRDIGYWAGYYDHETRERMERLFGAVHPFLPSTAEGEVDPAEAYKAGQRAAQVLPRADIEGAAWDIDLSEWTEAEANKRVAAMDDPPPIDSPEFDTWCTS